MNTEIADENDTRPIKRPQGFKTAILVLSLVLPVIGLALTYFYSATSIQFWIGLAMVASMGGAAFFAAHAHRLGFFEEIILVLAFLMSLTGIGLTNYSPVNSLRFWMAMTVFMAVSAMIIGAVKFVKEHKDIRVEMIITQLIHWGATLAAVTGVFLLLKAGRLNYDNTALVLLLVIGLSTFLDGYRISWRFSLIGILISGTAILAAFIEQFIWPVILLALVLLVVAIFWERHRLRQHRKNASQST